LLHLVGLISPKQMHNFEFFSSLERFSITGLKGVPPSNMTQSLSLVATSSEEHAASIFRF